MSERLEGVWDEERMGPYEAEEDGGPVAEALPVPTPEPEVPPDVEREELPAEEDELPRLRRPGEHAAGVLEIPVGYNILRGEPRGGRRSIAIVVSRFNGAITNRLLESALYELEHCGVARESVTVMPVPGAFELPLAALALAKSRRYGCVIALGCVIRGETPHFDFVAGEAASGLQVAALETGTPIAFGVLTVDSEQQAEARIDKGAEAARTALEMADVFAQLLGGPGAAFG